MQNYRQKLGGWGERLAASYLEDKGYTILGRNLRTRFGEIDLLARQGEQLVFVEVKTRRSTRYGLPEEAVTGNKKAHLLDAIQAYLQGHPELPGNYRVDVIAIFRSPKDRTHEIVQFENAFS